MEEVDLKSLDPEVDVAIRSEVEREKTTLVMIAAENYASRAVLEAQGNVMTNKYAEGYPGRRYYGGCEYVDIVESLAINRAKKLFGSKYVNVQPHSGSQANMAIYFSFLEPGDKIMGMDLSHGGHLTHGSPVNFSGRLFNAVSYGLNPESQIIDYDQVHDLAEKHKPKMIIAGASAYPRTVDFQKFRQISDAIGAYLMADMAHIAGLVAAKLHPSPVGYAHFITSTTHKTLRGPRGGLILAEEEYGQILDRVVCPGVQGGPLMHVIAAKAVSFGEALSQEFKNYQQQVIENARVLAEELIGFGFELVSHGTDNHLILIDLSTKRITGLRAQRVLEKAGIAVNKNSIPFDKEGPRVTSGIRIGTPALTTRGMKEPEMKLVARLIKGVLENISNDKILRDTRSTVSELCDRFPIYAFLDGEER